MAHAPTEAPSDDRVVVVEVRARWSARKEMWRTEYGWIDPTETVCWGEESPAAPTSAEPAGEPERDTLRERLNAAEALLRDAYPLLWVHHYSRGLAVRIGEYFGSLAGSALLGAGDHG